MIVVDASALLEVLLHTEAAEPVAERLLAHLNEIHAPHLIDAEVAQVIRRYVLHRMIDASLAAAAIEDLATPRAFRASAAGVGPCINTFGLRHKTFDMRGTCDYLLRMTIMIQIRNVPDETHRKLKARAALAGRTLSDYLLCEVAEIAERPTLDEMLARLRSLPPVELSTDPVDIIREERDRR